MLESDSMPTIGRTTLSHVVALSGGKDSTAMALRLHELNPDIDYMYVCTPTGDELPEMYEHWRALGERLGKPILPIMHPRGLNGLIEDYRALPNHRMRWCTRKLKIEPFAAFLLKVSPAISYVGLRADEPEREGGDYLSIPGIEMRFPMREWEWTIDDVVDYLAANNVVIPERTDCARCFFQTLHEWKQLLVNHPDIYQSAVNQERQAFASFRSDSRDTWPTYLDDLATQFAKRDPPVKKARGTGGCRVCRM